MTTTERNAVRDAYLTLLSAAHAYQCDVRAWLRGERARLPVR